MQLSSNVPHPSNNIKHFERIESLVTENWLAD